MPRNNQLALPAPRSPALNNAAAMSGFNAYTGQLAVNVQENGRDPWPLVHTISFAGLFIAKIARMWQDLIRIDAYWNRRTCLYYYNMVIIYLWSLVSICFNLIKFLILFTRTITYILAEAIVIDRQYTSFFKTSIVSVIQYIHKAVINNWKIKWKKLNMLYRM